MIVYYLKVDSFINNECFFITMIPSDKLGYYSRLHLLLRNSREQLQEAAGASRINLTSLSQLETALVREAFRVIAEQEREVLITFDPHAYTQDLVRMKRGDGSVCLLCDEEGNLLDMNPLLPFVSDGKRRKYELGRVSYLGSD